MHRLDKMFMNDMYLNVIFDSADCFKSFKGALVST